MTAITGLQRASSDHSAYTDGLRWQFELDRTTELDELIAVCRTRHLDHEVVAEHGGGRFQRRLLTVRCPAGVTVWFEGVNEADPASD